MEHVVLIGGRSFDLEADLKDRLKEEFGVTVLAPTKEDRISCTNLEISDRY